jgi:hypothetical protein
MAFIAKLATGPTSIAREYEVYSLYTARGRCDIVLVNQPTYMPSAYKTQLRLRREIKQRENAIHALENDAKIERMALGLRRCARAGVAFSFQQVNKACVSGRLVKLDGYDIQRMFGMDGYHDIFVAKLKGFDISVSANDGLVEIHVSWGGFKDGDELKAYLDQVRDLFRPYGVKMTADQARTKVDQLTRELAQYQTLIKTIEG